MKSTAVIWAEPVRKKLRAFRNEHFTVEETFDYVAHLRNGRFAFKSSLKPFVH
jgi:hypothetical protein